MWCDTDLAVAPQWLTRTLFCSSAASDYDHLRDGAEQEMPQMTRMIYAVPALAMLSAVTTMPVIAEAQTIIIINGSGAQPYYPQPYPYAYPQRQIVYDEPAYPSAYGYYPSYYLL